MCKLIQCWCQTVGPAAILKYDISTTGLMTLPTLQVHNSKLMLTVLTDNTFCLEW